MSTSGLDAVNLAVQSTLTAEDQALKHQVLTDCEDDRLLLLTEQPFTAKLMMHLELVPVIDDRLPTAGTDGTHIFFNARFMAERSDEDRLFILAHEVWHCALGHFRRKLGRDHSRWNAACDYEVNQLLKQMLGHCPQDALYDKCCNGRSAEWIYDQLEENRSEKRNRTLDEHDVFQAHDSPVGGKADPDFAPVKPHSSDRDVWRQRLLATAQQCKDGYGTLPGELRIQLEHLLEPLVSWQSLLRRFLQKIPDGGYSWTPPARRHIHRGLYLPRRRGEKLDICVAIDASGSCLDQVPEFMSQLHYILKAFNRVTLQVLTFDTQIQQEDWFTERDIHKLKSWSVVAGGGTDFRPIFEHLQARPPQGLVILSDWIGPKPVKAPAYPVYLVHVEFDDPAEL